MPEIILYLTNNDANLVREWINSEPDIAWIVKEAQVGCSYRWKVANEIAEMESKDYCLWHKRSSPLTIPSGSSKIEDTVILNPYEGWSQTLDHENANTPWFGAAAPGPFDFRFRENGRESNHSIGRSGFTWLGNYFSSIGKSAPEVSEKWWQRLRRFVKKNGMGIPWPGPIGSGKVGAYAFPEAYDQILAGRARDINP